MQVPAATQPESEQGLGAAATATAPRLRSLDVFRGATVALMILVNNPGSWSHLYPPLAHARWHGLTPTDLVFPFFLFAVGNALALVWTALQAGGPSAFWWRVLRRTALIFAIGLFLNAFPFVRWDAAGDLVLRDWESLRLMGVLQRIALAFGAAAVVVRLAGPRAAAPAAAALLLATWAITVQLGAPGDAWGLQGWFGTAVDRALLGSQHLYRGEGLPFEPEGLASTPGAVAQVLLGFWVGDGLRRHPLTRAQLLRWLAWAGSLLLLALLWQPWVPLNKKIWTPSYVLLTTACAIGGLLLLLVMNEARLASGIQVSGLHQGNRRAGVVAGRSVLAWPLQLCEAFGRNPLFVFVLSGLVPRALALLRWSDGAGADGEPAWITPLPWLYRHGFAGIGDDPRLSSLLFALANLALYAALALWLQRRGIHIRV